MVGILSADLALNLPDFRAGEKTFQLLTQAAGRAGRGELKSQIVLQTYAPDHPAIRFAIHHDFEGFYHSELPMREYFHYPPFYILVKLVFAHTDQEKTLEIADEWKKQLLEIEGVELLGPAPSPISKIQNLYRSQVLIKTLKLRELRSKLFYLRKQWESKLHRLTIDFNPMSML